MKKVLITMAMLAGMVAGGNLYAYQTNDLWQIKTKMSILSFSDSNSNLLFRGTQKVRANDGAEIYLYSNGSVQMYNSNGRLVAECTYNWDGDNEIFFIADGKTLYKGRCTVNQQKQLVSLTIAGDTYWKKS